MYRGVAYLPKDQLMRLFTWDKDGKRISYDTTFEPYIYLETNNHPDCTSIFNTKLKKKSGIETTPTKGTITKTDTVLKEVNIEPTHGIRLLSAMVLTATFAIPLLTLTQQPTKDSLDGSYTLILNT